MNKEFVPYEQSLELKELKFNEPCFALYSSMEEENHKFLWATSFLEHLVESQKKGHSFFDDSKGDKTRIQHFIKNSYAKNTVTAPTFSQAFRWFRKNYDLHSNVGLYNFHENTYCFNVVTKTIPHYLAKVTHFHSHEEAELECLKKLIELVKNK